MKQTNHTHESLGEEMTACNKLGLESVRQSLIEAMADFLDTDDMVMNEAYGNFKDPVKREESELHIRMADAALNAYSDTVLPQFAQQQTDKLYTREDMEKSFDAGKAYGYDSCLADNDGKPEIEPDFTEWFNQNYPK